MPGTVLYIKTAESQPIEKVTYPDFLLVYWAIVTKFILVLPLTI